MAMKNENQEFTKGTNVKEKDLQCDCGNEMDIVHVSNHHNDTGRFFVSCDKCFKSDNVSWKKIALTDQEANDLFNDALNDLKTAAEKLSRIVESENETWVHPMSDPQHEINIELINILKKFNINIDDLADSEQHENSK